MKKIYKYVLNLTTFQTVEIPRNATFISCQLQNDNITLWYLVTVENKPDTKTIMIYGTGNIIHENTSLLDHLGTIQQGGFVWHVFEKTTEVDK